MASRTFPKSDEYGPRKGLEGPFTFVGGRTLYYDHKEGQYWDPRTDFYLAHEEMNVVHSRMIERLKT